MYRATAEIVSGSKVFAGGKWLKCIGNKRVSVGERIWTDGRCIYGHFQEAQQPLVITGGDEDEAIPILIYDNDEHGKYKSYYDDASFHNYFFYRNHLREISKTSYRYKIQNAIMVNDTKKTILFQPNVNRACYANIDESGNIYQLKIQSDRHSQMYIYKNDDLIRTISFEELSSRCRQEVASAVGESNPVNAHSTLDYYILSGFIENENEWAVILQITASAYKSQHTDDFSYTTVTYGEYDRVGPPLPFAPIGLDPADWTGGTVYKTNTTTIPIYTRYSYSSVKSYLITQENQTLLYETSASEKNVDGVDRVISDYEIKFIYLYLVRDEVLIPVNYRRVVKESEHFFNINPPTPSDEKIPLPDGYYFVIKNFPSIPSGLFTTPVYMTITIFTANGNAILTETFHVNSYITIHKINTKRYLLAVKSHRFTTDYARTIDASLTLDSPDYNYRYLTNDINWVPRDPKTSALKAMYISYIEETHFVGNGLYIYDIETGLEKIAQGACINQRLRPVRKKYIRENNIVSTNLFN